MLGGFAGAGPRVPDRQQVPDVHEAQTESHRVIEMLWKVALADQRLDKYEDYVVRKVADLLYVAHSDLIRIRNLVRGD